VAHFAASIDKPETSRRFAESLDLDYPILSDPSKETARAYAVLRAMGLFAARHTFIIGKDGRILDIDTKVRARSSGKDLVARLEALGIPPSLASASNGGHDG
jgi:peroxiredoxin Q/BCP